MMPRNKSDRKLIVAISSSALFDLEASDKVFLEEGIEAYATYQIERETEVLEPGVAFVLVEKLLGLNDFIEESDGVEVILLSRNSADTGLRVFNSIQHYGLPISRAAFTSGAPPYPYMQPFGCHLFLSTNPEDVREALANGSAAASILPGQHNRPQQDSAQFQLKFAFDGDAVLFSDEAERIYQQHGLETFQASETAQADTPLPGGPFKPFLSALHQLQVELDQKAEQGLIRTALVTARSAPAHERVIKTLREWGVRLDESLFLGGMRKSDFLKAYDADVFFDDQAEHCAHASKVVPTGHVVHGVTNP
jgi:5'-nucleotidase